MTMAPSHLGLWLDLETILDLPLDPPALAVVWREILRQDSPSQFPLDQQARDCLVQALHQLELEWARERCEKGYWSLGLSKLEELIETCDFETVLAPVLLRLLPDLHYQLVDLADQTPPCCPFDDAERAELLWCAFHWLRRLNEHGIEQPERMAAIHEQIYRYGALAWMQDVSSPLANRRSLTLLLALSEINADALAWTKPACVERLDQVIGALDTMLRQGNPSSELMGYVDDLIQVVQQFQRIFWTSKDDDGPTLRLAQQLIDLKSLIEVWLQLKLA